VFLIVVAILCLYLKQRNQFRIKLPETNSIRESFLDTQRGESIQSISGEAIPQMKKTNELKKQQIKQELDEFEI
jgi:hypothetical protein